jgi:hypothetical protein
MYLILTNWGGVHKRKYSTESLIMLSISTAEMVLIFIALALRGEVTSHWRDMKHESADIGTTDDCEHLQK